MQSDNEMPRLDLLVKRTKGLVLDIGCIGGDFRMGASAPLSPLHPKLSEKNELVIGIDINRASLTKLKKIHPSLNLICTNAFHLPFAGDTFDTVVGGEFLEHIDNVGIFLDELWRVLRMHGNFVGDVPNAYDYISIYLLLFQRFPRSRYTTHVNSYDECTLRLLLLQHGFDVHVDFVSAESKSLKGKILKRVVQTFFPKLSTWISFVAKKVSKDESKILVDRFILSLTRGLGAMQLSNKGERNIKALK